VRLIPASQPRLLFFASPANSIWSLVQSGVKKRLRAASAQKIHFNWSPSIGCTCALCERSAVRQLQRQFPYLLSNIGASKEGRFFDRPSRKASFHLDNLQICGQYRAREIIYLVTLGA
jgi:hypothetical protein